MKIAFGIILLIIGIWVLFGIFRGSKPRYNSLIRQTQRAHSFGDIVNGTLLVILFMCTGILLLMDNNLWWMPIPTCVVLIIINSLLLGKRMMKELKGDHEKSDSS